MSVIKLLNSDDVDFKDRLSALREYEQGEDEEITTAVKTILADVQRDGDKAVIEYTNRFDKRSLKTGVL